MQPSQSNRAKAVTLSQTLYDEQMRSIPFEDITQLRLERVYDWAWWRAKEVVTLHIRKDDERDLWDAAEAVVGTMYGNMATRSY